MTNGERDEALYYFHEGTAPYAYRLMGAHIEPRDGGFLYSFRVLAPRAEAVYVVSDFFGWDAGHPMDRVNDAGVFELLYFDKADLSGAAYKFRICGGGKTVLKGDPYAFASRGGSDGASLLCGLPEYPFGDGEYMKSRRERISGDDGSLAFPMNVYEVHLGSFARREDGGYLSYAELAELLLGYTKYMGFTHVEILPIAEYPFDASWGYQVCGYYAPTARFGTPRDFCEFVDRLHAGGVGVILDWVPAHFPKDEWGLYEFDGAPLYEHSTPWRCEARGWGTRYFDLGRREVQSFLISNAVYWLREFHLDGLRVDAVASMLYLDYDRTDGEWEVAEDGTNLAVDAISFLRRLTDTVRREVGDALLIAEESTDFCGITKKTSDGGLGFHLKWNMGFANDLFDYLSTDPIKRQEKHSALTFPVTYAFSERYVLPISHDEVVYGKRAFLTKMHGGEEMQLATFRAAFLFIMTFPGKKLMFMGTECGTAREWDFDSALDFDVLNDARHDALREYVAALNLLYLNTPALYEQDHSEAGFAWLLPDEAERDLVAYTRYAKDGGAVIVVISFSGEENRDIVITPRERGRYECIFSSVGEIPQELDTGDDGSLTISLPPCDGVILARREEGVTIS